MAFTPWPGLCTGFEAGTIVLSPFTSMSGGCTLESTPALVHTGDYSLKLNNGSGWVIASYNFNILTTNDVYIEMWYYPATAGIGTPQMFTVQAVTTDNKIVSVLMNSVDAWDLYVDSVKVASGTIPVTVAWHHIAVHFVIDNTVGKVETYIDGTPDIVYNGDTQPGTDSTISYVGPTQGSNGHGDDRTTYVDDVTVGTGGWPADYHYTWIAPDADIDITNWTLIGGATAWEVLSERPPSDVDGAYTDVDDAYLQLRLADWVAPGETPAFVEFWARLMKDEAAAHQVEFHELDSGMNDVNGGAENILTALAYIAHIFQTAPDAGAWTQAKVDDLIEGIKALIV